MRLRSTVAGRFTLIETLVVLIVLGILAVIVVLALHHTAKQTVNGACVTDVRTIQRAEAAYAANHHSYATTTDALLNAHAGHLASWPQSTSLMFVLGDPDKAHAGYTLGVWGHVQGGVLSAQSGSPEAACTPA